MTYMTQEINSIMAIQCVFRKYRWSYPIYVWMSYNECNNLESNNFMILQFYDIYASLGAKSEIISHLLAFTFFDDCIFVSKKW